MPRSLLRRRRRSCRLVQCSRRSPPCANSRPNSLAMAEPFAISRVPPHARANGLDAGKSTCALPSHRRGGISAAPSSPLAAHTVTPSMAASCNTWLNCCWNPCALGSSGPPQEIEMIVGLFSSSCTALVKASIKPSEVLSFVEKYTTILAPGAQAPTTSMSSATSPSALSAVLGELVALSTDTGTTVGTGSPKRPKYASRSDGLYPPPNSMMPMT